MWLGLNEYRVFQQQGIKTNGGDALPANLPCTESALEKRALCG